MIRRPYGLLIVVAMIVMLSVAVGAGLMVVYPRLPDPSVATRQDLLRWLVLRDLSKESAEIRQKILSRLDTEFETFDDLDTTIESLEPSHRQMLWHNITVLSEPWLLGKVEQYSQLPVSQRTDYLDHFLDRAELWNKVGAACLKNNADGANGAEAAAKGGSSASQLLMEQMKQCSAHAAPDKRHQIGAFMAAVEARWLWRQLPSFNLFGKPAKK